MTLAAVGAGPLQGQAPKRLVQLQEVSVTGKRPLTDVGTTKTDLDTLTLRETVVNSMADVLSQNTPIFIKSYGRGSSPPHRSGVLPRRTRKCCGTA